MNHDEASDEDYDQFYEAVTSLSRQFSYALLRKSGQLWKGLTENEVKALDPDEIGDPDKWQPRDPQQLLEIFCRVKERLEKENEQLPVDHFLWYIDEEGERCNGSTQITLPPGGIELKLPHDPIVKLDGGHQDVNHRWELRKYDVHIDANLLAQSNREMEREIENYCKENGIDRLNGTFSVAFSGTSRIDPLVEVPVEWIPVQPVLDVLGYRVEVESVDALSTFQADLDTAMICCKQAIRVTSPLYWLMQ
ncbi:MAG TPA: hypothetical protein IGS53_02575 [Leptolyngbyaceae cyanobacterium M33_DOE_097]|nr:hypothetical protein [Leptolyngbyaceae cyanobacterium M33_DOE_097]